jgi:hypothetical protein
MIHDITKYDLVDDVYDVIDDVYDVIDDVTNHMSSVTSQNMVSLTTSQTWHNPLFNFLMF